MAAETKGRVELWGQRPLLLPAPRPRAPPGLPPPWAVGGGDCKPVLGSPTRRRAPSLVRAGSSGPLTRSLSADTGVGASPGHRPLDQSSASWDMEAEWDLPDYPLREGQSPALTEGGVPAPGPERGPPLSSGPWAGGCGPTAVVLSRDQTPLPWRQVDRSPRHLPLGGRCRPCRCLLKRKKLPQESEWLAGLIPPLSRAVPVGNTKKSRLHVTE